MLDKDALKEYIETAFHTSIVPALENAMLRSYPYNSEYGKDHAHAFALNFGSLAAEPFAEVLADVIDYYVKNITITGTIITVGSPTTQTATIMPAPNPMSAGSIPNTLKIS